MQDFVHRSHSLGMISVGARAEITWLLFASLEPDIKGDDLLGPLNRDKERGKLVRPSELRNMASPTTILSAPVWW